MIDSKHRLRSERVHKYKANLLRDIKFLFTSAWNELFSRNSSESSYHNQQDNINNYGAENDSDRHLSTSASNSNNENASLIKRSK